MLGCAWLWSTCGPVPAGCCGRTGQDILEGGEVASNHAHTAARGNQATKLHCGWLRLIATWPLRVWALLLQDPSSVSESAVHRRGASGLQGRSSATPFLSCLLPAAGEGPHWTHGGPGAHRMWGDRGGNRGGLCTVGGRVGGWAFTEMETKPHGARVKWEGLSRRGSHQTLAETMCV